MLLARAGGWRRERQLRSGQRVEGRLWERTPPGELGLTFSRQSLELLMWFTAENPTDKLATVVEVRSGEVDRRRLRTVVPFRLWAV